MTILGFVSYLQVRHSLKINLQRHETCSIKISSPIIFHVTYNVYSNLVVGRDCFENSLLMRSRTIQN